MTIGNDMNCLDLSGRLAMHPMYGQARYPFENTERPRVCECESMNRVKREKYRTEGVDSEGYVCPTHSFIVVEIGGAPQMYAKS